MPSQPSRFVPALFALTLLAAGAAKADPALTRGLDAVIDGAMAEKRIVGAVVLVARDGKIVYSRAAGQADREAARPMQENTIFLLASVTKPIVTAAAMRLVESGKLSLDDEVARWLPGFRPRLADGSAPAIRIRHLLNHTSGLSYRFFEPESSPYHRLNVSDGLDQPGLSLAENLRRLAEAPLGFAPGSRWHYSLATDVLGAVIEKASGQSLPEAVRTLVIGPLSMSDTGFGAADPGRLATPYADGKPEPRPMRGETAVPFGDTVVRFVPDRWRDPASYPSGGAGMAGTAGDVLRFLEAIRLGGAPILKPETVETMLADSTGPEAATQGPGWGFGYGWAVLVDPKATGTPQSKGTIQWGGAYGHNWFVDPAERLTVVALTNTTFEGMAGRFTTELRDAVYKGRRSGQ